MGRLQVPKMFRFQLSNADLSCRQFGFVEFAMDAITMLMTRVHRKRGRRPGSKRIFRPSCSRAASRILRISWMKNFLRLWSESKHWIYCKQFNLPFSVTTFPDFFLRIVHFQSFLAWPSKKKKTFCYFFFNFCKFLQILPGFCRIFAKFWPNFFGILPKCSIFTVLER